MKRMLLLTVACLTATLSYANDEMDKFISDLMSKMTLEQKIGQLNLLPMKGDVVTGPDVSADIAQLLKDDQLGAVMNLNDPDKVYTLQKFAVEESGTHIPLLIGFDVVHGYKTIFPVPVGLSCSWDPALAEKTARISAMEATSCGCAWTYAPMVDIAHDARWGRIAEGSGEDPYLGSAFARAYVKGFQGDLSGKGDQMLSCVKHYALYGASDGGLDYTAVDMSRSRMFNYYMAPYQAAVEEGVASVMTCFNEVEGVPGAANEFLLQDILRGKWGFDGFVVSDYDGVKELCKHGLGTPEEVTVRSFNAGNDMDMCSLYFVEYIAGAVKEGKIKEQTVNDACRRILEAKYKLGLFEDPYRFCRTQESRQILDSKEFHTAAREIATESIVLLKNDNQILPLKRSTRIALVGPYGKETKNIIGTWYALGSSGRHVSFYEGLLHNGAIVEWAQGSNICFDPALQELWSNRLPIPQDSRSSDEMIKEALEVAGRSDVIIAAVGEPAQLSGEGACRVDLTIPDAQKELLRALKSTGKKIVLVVFSGRPLELSWEAENMDAILYAWHPGSEAGNALSDLIYGNVNPSGHLTASFMRSSGQYPYYYNHTPSARQFNGKRAKFSSSYMDCDPTPLYPFGYGLSYTTFEFSEPKVKVLADAIEVKFDVKNTGSIGGKTVAQMYVRDLSASQARPVCELKGFEKAYIEPGKKKTFTFSLTRDDLSFYNNNLDFIFEPGEFKIMCGPDCEHTKSVTVNFGEKQ